MQTRYKKLLSPLKVGGAVLKNRMSMSQAIPVCLYGVEEDVPFDSMISYAGTCAAAGASIVPLGGVVWKNPHSRPMKMPPRPGEEDLEDMTPDDGLPAPPGEERKGVDFKTRNNQMRFARAAEAIHNQGSLACMGLSEVEPSGWNINDIPLEYLEELPNRFARAAVDYMAVGVDVGCIHMSYGGSLLCNSISPRNRRTDKYGGNNMQERAKLSLEVFHRIKEVCPDMILEVQVSGEETPGGYTLEELCEYVKLCDDVVDIFQIRGATDIAAHPTGINLRKENPITLHYAEVLKRTGTKAIIAPVGGYHDPDLIEKWLSEDKFDMVFMARTFISEPHYEQKLRSGQEPNPCLLCNKCHCRPGDPEFGCCTNPMLAISLDPVMSETARTKPAPKKVAVIGGGPAGMEAAIVASGRGHSVTLYEKSGVLGGQMLHSDYSAFKWPMKDFKDYLIRQVSGSGTKVCLNTEATPEALESEHYDVILMASGASEKLPPIPGIETANVRTPQSVYGHAAELGSHVVVIGGGDTGLETAWYLAMEGLQVTMISRRRPEPFDQLTEQYEDLLAKTGSGGSLTKKQPCTTTRVEDGRVTVQDAHGNREVISCDSIVACGGMEPVRDNVLEFADVCDVFRVIGDCRKVRDIRVAMKTACSAALSI